VEIGERVKRYKAIEALRERPLIVYATSTRLGVPAMMAGDAVREFTDQIDAIPAGDAVDILIHSTGGDALAAWKLMSTLRERFDQVAVLVPFMAFSAATIFALGADEIVMHPHASLGPIDPQITIKLPDGSLRQFSFEDVGAFLRFVKDKNEVGITEQAYISSVVEKLFSVVDAVNVGGAKRASELSTDVGERLLQMHMTGAKERQRARSIADGLNKSFFAHGDAVSRSRARSLKLKVAADNPALEKLLWQAYLGLEGYMELRTPFNPLQHFLGNGGAPALAPQPPVVVPPNTPPQLVNQIWTQVAQNALQALAQPAIEVPYSIANAVMESVRVASEFRTEGRLSAARLGGGEIRVAATDHVSGWRRVPLTPATPAPVAGAPAPPAPPAAPAAP
jgi:hypothetical protein